MTTAVIVDVVRTPSGAASPGACSPASTRSTCSPTCCARCVERNGLDPALVDDVIVGCVSQVGEQALQHRPQRRARRGLPRDVPGTTIDRQCGSSQQAAHFAAQGVIAGAYDIVIACGVESMSRVPLGSRAAGRRPVRPRCSTRATPRAS